MNGLLAITLGFSLWILPFILARRGWSSRDIGYTVAAITTSLVIIFGGNASEDEIRTSSLPILLLNVVSGTLISGTILWGIVALARKAYARLTTKNNLPGQ